MNLRRGVLDILGVVLGAAMIAALVHIAAILIIPLYATRDAFARLTPLGPINATVVLAQPGPRARLLPFRDPAVASAFCRFDLTRGPLRVRAPVDDSGFASLSFHPGAAASSMRSPTKRRRMAPLRLLSSPRRNCARCRQGTTRIPGSGLARGLGRRQGLRDDPRLQRAAKPLSTRRKRGASAHLRHRSAPAVIEPRGRWTRARR